MIRTIGDFKFSITPQLDENEVVRPQLIILNCVDPYDNKWQAEFVDFFDTEAEAEKLALEVIEALTERDKRVEEEVVI